MVNNSQSQSRFNRVNERPPRYVEVSAVVLLVLLSVYVVRAVVPSLDLEMSDEITYALPGHLWPHTLLTSNWSPLYSLWHSVLYFFVPDRTSEYYFNASILTTVLPLLLYCCLRTLGIPIAGAWSAALIFLTLDDFVRPDTGVSEFACLLVGIGVMLMHSAGRSRSSFLGSTLLLILSYARSEFFLGFIFLGGRAVLGSMRTGAAGCARAAFYLVASFIAIKCWGNPMHDADYARSVEVFGQVNAIYGQGPERESNLRWRELLAEQWGGEVDHVSAFLTRPKDTLRLIGRCLEDSPRVMMQMIRSSSLTANGGELSRMVLGGFRLLLPLVVVASLFGIKRIDDPELRRFVLVCLFCSLVPIIVSYPQPRYFVAALYCIVISAPFIANSFGARSTAKSGYVLEKPAVIYSLILGEAYALILLGVGPDLTAYKPKADMIETLSPIQFNAEDKIVVCPERMKGWFRREEYAKTEVTCSILEEVDRPVVVALLNGASARSCPCLKEIETAIKPENNSGFQWQTFRWGTLGIRTAASQQLKRFTLDDN